MFTVQIRRSEDFFISSSLEINCNGSFFTIIQWTISNCTSHCGSPLDLTLITTSNDLFIPAGTLACGTYQLTLTVSMLDAPHLSSSSSAYIKIISSSVIANLVRFGVSMITHGYAQNLLLDPGTFSVDPDVTIFPANVSLNISTKSYLLFFLPKDWNYSYYCRLYGLYDFPNRGGVLLTMDDLTIDPHNHSCLFTASSNDACLFFLCSCMSCEFL